jgi:hypothetical protein
VKNCLRLLGRACVKNRRACVKNGVPSAEGVLRENGVPSAEGVLREKRCAVSGGRVA